MQASVSSPPGFWDLDFSLYHENWPLVKALNFNVPLIPLLFPYTTSGFVSFIVRETCV
jgi:hypothetical protein